MLSSDIRSHDDHQSVENSIATTKDGEDREEDQQLVAGL